MAWIVVVPPIPASTSPWTTGRCADWDGCASPADQRPPQDRPRYRNGAKTEAGKCVIGLDTETVDRVGGPSGAGRWRGPYDRSFTGPGRLPGSIWDGGPQQP